MNDLQVRWCDIDTVIPYARNSRKIPERAIDKVGCSAAKGNSEGPLGFAQAERVITQ
jgi:hypothetical protein